MGQKTGWQNYASTACLVTSRAAANRPAPCCRCHGGPRPGAERPEHRSGMGGHELRMRTGADRTQPPSALDLLSIGRWPRHPPPRVAPVLGARRPLHLRVRVSAAARSSSSQRANISSAASWTTFGDPDEDCSQHRPSARRNDMATRPWPAASSMTCGSVDASPVPCSSASCARARRPFSPRLRAMMGQAAS